MSSDEEAPPAAPARGGPLVAVRLGFASAELLTTTVAEVGEYDAAVAEQQEHNDSLLHRHLEKRADFMLPSWSQDGLERFGICTPAAPL